mmetsp:Transcript_39490/g.97770  ORF Transcript_39490/g.97770 Transcript_39490/m.97770 type:complete len:128 (+) Transcript_39490:58-441(+)
MSFAVASSCTVVARAAPTSNRGLAARQRVAVSVVTIAAPRSSARLASSARRGAVVMAKMGGAGGDDKDGKPPEKILRTNEKEAWLSEMEKDPNANPLKDPMALVAIGGISVPFIILAIAGAAGYLGQ